MLFETAVLVSFYDPQNIKNKGNISQLCLDRYEIAVFHANCIFDNQSTVEIFLGYTINNNIVIMRLFLWGLFPLHYESSRVLFLNSYTKRKEFFLKFELSVVSRTVISAVAKP